MSSFGKTLRNLRTSNDLTQTQLADALGLAFSTISMYERGEREPDFEILEAIRIDLRGESHCRPF